MTPADWIIESLGRDHFDRAQEQSRGKRISLALRVPIPESVDRAEMARTWLALDLRVFQVLEGRDRQALRDTALDAFQLGRSLDEPTGHTELAEHLLRLSCFGVLADRSPDVHRILKGRDFSRLQLNSEDWGVRVRASIYDLWLRLLRKDGWEDMDAILERVANLRSDQADGEPKLLQQATKSGDQSLAWGLMTRYHLAKAAEILSVYLCHGSVENTYDVREQLQSQFDRALIATERAQNMELENLSRLLAKTSEILVENSIWTVTRAVNSRVTKFVEQVTSRGRKAPIFTVLPPQREVLLKEGLLGSAHRSVVVSLPTSSGKTFIAQFRMLQALNQFDNERGWVAYLAPTRALVNQITLRLRRDFEPFGVNVEKVSPALEVDGLEAGLLSDSDAASQFRVLVTTPEKLDLMLRCGWEAEIGRPLTLVIVDEAHGLDSQSRGLKLELLLATINRECKFAQFLLLTPFISNAKEIAQWLSPDSNRSMEMAVEWSPNDRIIAIAHRRKTEGNRGAFTVELESIHTTRPSLTLNEKIVFSESRPLGLSWSEANSPGKLAAATAHLLAGRGTVIVLVTQPDHTWGIAQALKETSEAMSGDPDVEHIATFLSEEMGEHFPLVSLVRYGVGVHHSGLSEDTRTLIEWLTEKGHLRTLVATTTIAQGVNFPVSGVVFASHQYPYGKDMPAEDFWNIAGRAGRVDQNDIGVVALVAPDDAKAAILKTYLQKATGSLNSTLIGMVQEALSDGELPNLETLSYMPAWSAFLQYLVHSYRQIGNHERFANLVETVLRGTLGFQELRRSNPRLAVQLVNRVQGYAGRLQGRPLALVDSTGFSLESVMGTLGRISEQRLDPAVWSTDLFDPSGQESLKKMMGLLLEIPELRENLIEVGSGGRNAGDRLARIVTDWVHGRALSEIAADHFPASDTSDEKQRSSMTSCCRMIFGRLAQTASWGISALQSLSLGDSLEGRPEEVVRQIRNLPSWVYYGVNSDEAMAVRMLGVPRTAANAMAVSIGVGASEPISSVRQKLKNAPIETWEQALGTKGATYRRVWQIVEGEA